MALFSGNTEAFPVSKDAPELARVLTAHRDNQVALNAIANAPADEANRLFLAAADVDAGKALYIAKQRERRHAPESETLADFDRDAADKRERAKRQRELAEPLREAASAEGSCLVAVERWIARHAGRPVKVVLVEAIGADLVALKASRLRREEIIKALSDLAGRPGRNSELIAPAIEVVEQYAERGRPPLDRRIVGADPFRLSQVFAFGLHGNSFTGDNGRDFLIWLHREAIIAKLKTELGPEAADAISAADRAAQRRELEAQLLTAERVEEATIRACIAVGLRPARRPDASPLAVLGIALIEEERP